MGEKYEVHFNIFQSGDAKQASFATTGALAPRRSAVYRLEYFRDLSQI